MKPPKGGLRDDQPRTERYQKQTGNPVHANPPPATIGGRARFHPSDREATRGVWGCQRLPQTLAQALMGDLLCA
jgi:hypothetical protein